MKPTPQRMARRVPDADDRFTCNTCSRLVRGQCQATDRRVFRDVPRDVPHRCAGFAAAQAQRAAA